MLPRLLRRSYPSPSSALATVSVATPMVRRRSLVSASVETGDLALTPMVRRRAMTFLMLSLSGTRRLLRRELRRLSSRLSRREFLALAPSSSSSWSTDTWKLVLLSPLMLARRELLPRRERTGSSSAFRSMPQKLALCEALSLVCCCIGSPALWKQEASETRPEPDSLLVSPRVTVRSMKTTRWPSSSSPSSLPQWVCWSSSAAATEVRRELSFCSDQQVEAER